MDGIDLRPETRIDRSRLSAAIKTIADNAPRHDAEASFPHDSLAALHAAGLLAVTARTQDGGLAGGLADAARIIGEVGAACPSTALILAMQYTHLAAAARNPAWPEEIRSLVARGAAERGELLNTLRVEPELGTPARGGLPATIARRTETGWSITGRKIYSTGAPGLTWGLVFVRTDDETPRTGMVLVPMDAPGVRIEPSWDHLGLRATGSHDVVFEDVAVPFDYAVDLRAPADWLRGDPDQAAWNAVLMGSLYTGIAGAARNWLVDFLRHRVPANLGAPLATLPRMQEAVGTIESLLLTNRVLLTDLAARYDDGQGPPAHECGLTKHIACENAIAVVQQAVALIGNHALARRNPLERHLRDVLCARIHTPQADAALGAAGRAALLIGNRK